MMFWALDFAADIVAGLVARVKKLRRKEMVGCGCWWKIGSLVDEC